MRKFDYSFLNNGLLPANLVNLTFNIAALKTMAGVRKDEYTQIFTELEAVAKVQSIKSSNAIEGIVTSDERIAAMLHHLVQLENRLKNLVCLSLLFSQYASTYH